MGNPADTITVSDVSPRTATQQLTGFIDDAASVPASLPFSTEPQESLIAASMEARQHTIIDVLSRPHIIAQGSWTDSLIRDDLVANLNFPEDMFSTSINIVDKLNYFTYLRADVCVRVIVNANTFQAGKLLGYFSPFDDLIGNRAAASDHTAAYTAYPHVLLDASTGNVAELRIPYVSPYSSYRLTDSTGSIGNFYLRVLNPLRDGACTYTVYAWFTNISVDLPSGRENSLGSFGKSLTEFRKFLRGKSSPPDLKLRDGGNRFVAQVAGEEEQKSTGMISSTLHTISKIAEVSSGIPLIGEVAAPISWVTKFAGNIAAYFGYSKSQNQSTPCTMISIPGKGYTNATGVDNSVILATSDENQIEPRNDVFGSRADDMDITYLVKHRCYIDSFEMADNDSAGSLLYSFPVTPAWAKFSNGVFQPSVTAFVASMFAYWRGGLRFKIQAAKTAYHSGRIRIVYLPAASNANVDDAEQAYNWVLDLRNSSEVEFTIPYNNIVEWSVVQLTNAPLVASNQTIGVIRIEVLNELRAPESVTPSIEFNIWMAGDSDLQFAVPDFRRYVPSLPDTALSLKSQALGVGITPYEFEAQVLGNQQDSGFSDMNDKPQLFSMRVPDKIVPCKNTIGEIITNLRYLTRRFSPYSVFTKTDPVLTLDIPNYYFVPIYDPASGTSVSEYYLTPLDYISYLYRFFRGGTRYKFMLEADNIGSNVGYQEASMASALPSVREPSIISEAVYNRIAYRASSFMHRVYSIINPVLEVVAPFYSQSILRPIVGVDVSQPSQLNANSLTYKWFSDGTGDVRIYKAAHDDFSFGWIVGPPTLRALDSGDVVVGLTNAQYSIIGETNLTFKNLTFIPQPANGSYPGTSQSTLDVFYTDGSFDVEQFILIGVSIENEITVIYNPGTRTLDEAQTLSNLQNLGSIIFNIT